MEINAYREWDNRGRQYKRERNWKGCGGAWHWGQKSMPVVFSSKITTQGQVKFPLDVWEILSFSTGKTQASLLTPAMEREGSQELGPGENQP